MVFGFKFGKKRNELSTSGLINLVRDRKKAGYGLRELGIQNCIGFGARQVRECEKDVNKVIWDGDEGEDHRHTCTHHNHHLEDDDDDDDDDDQSLNEYDAHYQIYGRSLWDFYDSDGVDDYLPYY